MILFEPYSGNFFHRRILVFGRVSALAGKFARVKRAVDRCSVARGLLGIFVLLSHACTCRRLYRERFLPLDDVVPILDLLSPGATLSSARFLASTAHSWHFRRGKFRPTSNQPVYSTVCSLCIRENSVDDQEDAF